MSEGIVRKVQPFTIGTRLSIPAPGEFKCPDFLPQSSWQSGTLGNITLQSSLQERVSLYLSQAQVCGATTDMAPLSPQLVPLAKWTPMTHVPLGQQQQEDNAALPPASTATRSIKKITISGSSDKEHNAWRKSGHSDHRGVHVGPLLTPGTEMPRSENNNNNNNNNKSGLARILGVSCENQPSSQLKMLLRKESNPDQQPNRSPVPGSDLLPWSREKTQNQALGPRTSSPNKDKYAWTIVVEQNDRNTKSTDLFNHEVLQVEAWIAGKHQEMDEGCDIQKDLRDFENTFFQLNQTREQQSSKLNPSSECVKKQLSQVRDQWQALKERTVHQQRAVGGAINPQEFNRKVDKLEAWIKEKGEEWAQMKVLGDNPDKLQLTRRILDLKQDEQMYRTLHEEINQLALTLEKQGRPTETKNISTRRKHINMLWLKVQSLLKDYHDHLRLALEVSSFYQQADNALSAIKKMRTGISVVKNSGEEREIRDIASQIMMLDVSMSQLSIHHPALAQRVSLKQTEVKDCWSHLQNIVRTTRLPTIAPASLPGSDFSSADGQPLTWAREPQDSRPKEPHRIMGKEVKEDPNMKDFVSVQGEGLSESHAPGTTRESAVCFNVSPPKQQTGGERQVNVEPRLQSGSTRLQSGSARLQSGSSRRGHPNLRLYIPEPHAENPQPNPQLQVVAIPQPHPPLQTQRCSQPHPPVQNQRRPQPRQHFQTQLQKFTVSADKTLLWLKENVVMATQVCSLIGSEAKRLQDVLGQELFTNKDRIEVVKKEGRGLVNAQHPSSRKIQEFLSRLDDLWEELKRRHHRNHIYLQSEEEDYRVVKVLQALGCIEAWLQAVDLSLWTSQLAGDPETMRLAEREGCLLQKELCAQGLVLATLRQEVDRLGGHQSGEGSVHPNAEGPQGPQTHLSERMEQVERKYQSVQTVLIQRSSSLQDRRMLTEFLERVELESQEDREEGYNSSSRQPLHTKMRSASSLLGDGCGEVAVPLMKAMGDPVEELREAVEMLNDTVRERGRVQNHIHDQAIQNLIRQLGVLSMHVEGCLCCSIELTLDLVRRETDMAVRCEPDGCGLGDLEEQQHHLEVDYAKLMVEIEALQRETCNLVKLCPDRVSTLGVEVQETMTMWRDLGKNMEENRHRLQQFVALQDFFRNYLAIILWTEDTRAFIFSETVLHCGKDGKEPMTEEMEMDILIDKKFEEFEELNATGRTLLDTEHHLANMIRERLEELRSMLDWILIHWRAQKHRRSLSKPNTENTKEIIYSEPPGDPTAEPIYSNTIADHTSEDTIYTNTAELLPEDTVDNIYSEAIAGSPQRAPALSESHQPTAGTVSENQQQPAEDLDDDYQVMNSDGYEVMNSVQGLAGGGFDLTVPQTISEPSSPALCLGDSSVNSKPGVILGGSMDRGGIVNLILSLGKLGDSHVEVMEEKEEEEESAKPVHRVSTYLHVKENNMAASAPVYESITLPRLRSKTQSSSASSSGPPCFVSSSSPPTSTSTSRSIFSTQKKKGKSKTDSQRHTMQRIMGVEGEEQTEQGCPAQASTQPITSYNTQTWPMKDGRSKKKSQSKAEEVGPGTGVDLMDYVQNPLAKDINDECCGVYTISPYAVTEASSMAPPRGPVRSHCRFLSLGSVLTFDLPKDMRLVPSIHDIITIGPPEHRGGPKPKCNPNPNLKPHTERNPALSSFKQATSSLSPPSCLSHHMPTQVMTQTQLEPCRSHQDEDFPPPPPALSKEIDKSDYQTLSIEDLSLPQTVPSNDKSDYQTLSSEDLSLPQTVPNKDVSLPQTVPSKDLSPPQTMERIMIGQTPEMPGQSLRPGLISLELNSSSVYQNQEPSVIQVSSQQGPSVIQVSSHQGPSVIQVSSHQGPSVIQVPSHQGPSVIQVSSHQGPSVMQVSSHQGPSVMQVSSHQGPSVMQVPSHQGPSVMQGSSHQGPSVMQGSSHQGPSVIQGSSHQGPSVIQGSSHQGPSVVQGSSHQGPSVVQGSSHQGPSVMQGSSHQGPSVMQGSSHQGPSVIQGSCHQGPSVIQGSSHQGPCVIQGSSQSSQMVVILKTSGLDNMRRDSNVSNFKSLHYSEMLQCSNVPEVLQCSNVPKVFQCSNVSEMIQTQGKVEDFQPETRMTVARVLSLRETDSDPVHQNNEPDLVLQNTDSDPVHQSTEPDLVLQDKDSDPVHQNTEPDLVLQDKDSDPVHQNTEHDLLFQDWVHPDHHQFEELEEELEDIWKHINSYRESFCSDIMYQPHQEEGGGSSSHGISTDPSSPSFPPPTPPKATPYRKLITSSAPNLLVGEFTLPALLQTLKGSNESQGNAQQPNPREELPILGSWNRRSWATFPNQGQPWSSTALENETGIDRVKLPQIEDQQKYIYQYKEEEDEEKESEKGDLMKMEDIGCLKDQSASLLSVHSSRDRDNNRASLDGEMVDQGQRMTTGGRCDTTKDSCSGLQLQSMEGPLERKQKLQLGGKKAGSRAWSAHHAVLYKQTLCFYQDRKDTLRSSVCGLPLNLRGAVCVMAPEYTKKPHCFSLRLRDGSEYLLSTTSLFSMKKWMLKIQANTEDHFGSMGQKVSARSRESSPTSLPHTQPGCCFTSDQVCHSNKHRSHSFSSATYHKMKPVMLPPGGRVQESIPSYSVTLVIGDKQSDARTVSYDDSGPSTCKTNRDFYQPNFHQQDTALQSYISLPQQRKKSVFKKFFGKKDVLS
ncbi:uncharacterized protein LOC106023986 isoform X3 [Esox lucius]|uniref:uncharacterized protein LOC106023986 isoform X3 n=1 Tax=Esox lucius TaxID=8010 RepID=UPI0014775CC0|nr:uncharacterized protein LOC106023986 isoform X3 [Esox lucius]